MEQTEKKERNNHRRQADELLVSGSIPATETLGQVSQLGQLVFYHHLRTFKIRGWL